MMSDQAFKRVFLCLVSVAIAIETAQGIKCWVCDGKRTLKECHAQYGRMQECDNPTDVCQNDFRTAQGKPLITKGCKQKTACETEVKQNKDKNQCGRKMTKNLVCRCCCATDGCNSKASGCKPPPAPCKPIKSLANGKSFCDREIEFGSRCSFRCNPGYEMKGLSRSTCVRISKKSTKGRWTKLPKCEKVIIRCDPPKVAPKNGVMKCVNSKEYKRRKEFNYEGSTCTYSCKPNFYLVGKKNTVCGNRKKWNNEDPVCQRGTCEPGSEDPNRVEKCTSGYSFGSECEFGCKKGFTLLGSKTSSCEQSGTGSRGFWTEKFPRCAEVSCYPELTNPANGKVSCTRENLKNSVCTFTCDPGYDLDNTQVKSLSSTCEDDENGDALGVWSDKPPTCSRIVCEPAMLDPSGGQVVCTDRNRFGSECKFTCDTEHDLAGTKDSSVTAKCEDDGDGDNVGEWSRPTAVCDEITCKPAFKKPEDGVVSCTNGNSKNSVCTFECDPFYDLDGTIERTTTSTCIPPEDGTATGTWSRVKPPKCSAITCPWIPRRPNTLTICSASILRGSFCVSYCTPGYETTGQHTMTCEDLKQDGDSVGEWSAPPAVCVLGRCSATKYNKETVIEDCTPPEGYNVEEYRVGTVCRYRCRGRGYYMVENIEDDLILSGEVEATCDNEKRWTKSPPRCILKTCRPEIQSLDNGYTPLCTDGNNYGSKCTFRCQKKYALTHDRPLTCEDDGDDDEYGKWSDETPQCERSECDEFGTVVNGRLNCTDGVNIGSVCALECIDRYTTKKYRATECLPSARWSRRKYYCCVRCLFNRRLNILAMFDHSSFETSEDWTQIVDFTKAYLYMMARYGFELQFGAFGYSDEVDKDKEIPIERIRSRFDLDRIVAELADLKHSGDVAYTGKALTYANDEVFPRIDRNREHFIILATAGRSRDKVEEISKTLRERNINILVVGVKSKGTAELLEIAGVSRNVFTGDKAQDLQIIPAKINEISRNTGCTPASRTQSCP